MLPTRLVILQSAFKSSILFLFVYYCYIFKLFGVLLTFVNYSFLKFSDEYLKITRPEFL